MLTPDLQDGTLAIFYRWKEQYLFPYGDVAPLSDFESNMAKRKNMKKKQTLSNSI